MARIRSIKPEFWEDEKVGALSCQARLLFLALISHADDAGRLRAAPAHLRALAFRYDDLDIVAVEHLLAEVVAMESVEVYEGGGERYACVVNFREHQRIDRPTESRLPPPPRRLGEGSASNRGTLAEGSPADMDMDMDQGKDQTALPPEPGDIDLVFTAWLEAKRQLTGKPSTAKLDAKRRRLITLALAAYPLIDVLDAVRGWLASPHHRGENDRRTVYNDLGLLLRDADHIERFRDLARGAGVIVDQGSRSRNAQAFCREHGLDDHPGINVYLYLEREGIEITPEAVAAGIAHHHERNPT
jgi:hypothetical protein